MIRSALALMLLALPGRAQDFAPVLLKGVDAAFLGAAGPGAGSSARSILISGESAYIVTEEGLYDIGRGRPAWRATAGFSDACVAASRLLVVVGDRLGEIENGKFRPRVRLPSPGMRMKTSPRGSAIYLYGGSEPSVYRYGSGGRYERLLETKKPVGALDVADGRLFFAVGTDIFTYKDGQEAVRLASLSTRQAVESLAADPQRSVLYISAGADIWALHGSTLKLVASGLEGPLLARPGGSLWVYDGFRRGLVALRHASKAVFK